MIGRIICIAEKGVAALKRVVERLFGGRQALLWVCLLGLALLRLSWQGFTYQPLLDDHIQYYNYANLMGGLPQAASKLGLLAARPLAGLLDILWWSRYWPRLFGAVVALTALLALAVRVLADLFGELLGTDPLCFGIVFLLLPANFEATYWLSAATRVVPGLLLAALAGRCTLLAMRGARPFAHLSAAGLFCLLAACFYEQAFVLAAALCLLVGLLAGGSWPLRLAPLVPPLAAFALYLALTSAAGPSALYGGRAALNLPLGNNAGQYFSVFLPELLRQLAGVFAAVPKLTLRALLRSLPLLTQHLPGLLCGLLLLAAALWSADGAPDRQRPLRALAVGLCLTLAPMAPFLVVNHPWVSLRALGCCLPGIALLGSALLQLLPGRPLRHGATALLALLFLTASVSELADYRQTAQNDARAVAAIAAALPQLEGAQQVGVLGLMPGYLEDQNYEWHEHLHGVTESRWALTGALRAACSSLDVPTVTPLCDGRIYPDYADLSQYDAFLLVGEGFSMQPVTHDGEGVFTNAAGQPVALVLQQPDGAQLTIDNGSGFPRGKALDKDPRPGGCRSARRLQFPNDRRFCADR